MMMMRRRKMRRRRKRRRKEFQKIQQYLLTQQVLVWSFETENLSSSLQPRDVSVF